MLTKSHLKVKNLVLVKLTKTEIQKKRQKTKKKTNLKIKKLN